MDPLQRRMLLLRGRSSAVSPSNPGEDLNRFCTKFCKGNGEENGKQFKAQMCFLRKTQLKCSLTNQHIIQVQFFATGLNTNAGLLEGQSRWEEQSMARSKVQVVKGLERSSCPEKRIGFLFVVDQLW
jgi:hypothetical protein